LESGGAYTTDLNNNYMELQWTEEALESCSTGNNNLYSCAVRRSIVAGEPQDTSGVHDFAFANYTNDDVGCTNFLTTNLLGINEFSLDLSRNMTQLVRSKFGIDNYLRRAWYVNPAVNWPEPGTGAAQSSLFLADKMIGLAVVSLRDSATGITRAHQLMSMASSGDQRRHGFSVTMEHSRHAERSAATKRIQSQPIKVIPPFFGI
jgi:hypothetical protein